MGVQVSYDNRQVIQMHPPLEAIRRDFSLRVKERILQMGFVLLVLLMGIVLYNDILKVF
jgi:membrane-associated protease RseP (regulator of RpoE activity)